MCLEATGATKIYGKTTVLQNVSMNVFRGEIHGLVGRNGAGKSTLVGGITGLVTLDHGQVILDGVKLEPGDPEFALNAGIALVPQQMSSFPTLSVGENLLVGRLPMGKHGLVNVSSHPPAIDPHRLVVQQLELICRCRLPAIPLFKLVSPY